MTYTEKDLFLILTALCFGMVVYLVINLWRSSNTKKIDSKVKKSPKRTERIRRIEPTKPSVKPASVKSETKPSIPTGVIFLNERGVMLGALRRTPTNLVNTFSCQNNPLPEFLQALIKDYFALKEDEGIIIYRLDEAKRETIARMQVFDQDGNLMIEVPLNARVFELPSIRYIDYEAYVADRIDSLFRQRFLTLGWREQSFLMRLQKAPVKTLVQVPLQETLSEELVLLLISRLAHAKSFEERISLFNRLDRHLYQNCLLKQIDGSQFNQWINSITFAPTQRKAILFFVTTKSCSEVVSL